MRIVRDATCRVAISLSISACSTASVGTSSNIIGRCLAYLRRLARVTSIASR